MLLGPFQTPNKIKAFGDNVKNATFLTFLNRLDF